MGATEPGCFDALASATLEKCTLSAKAVWQLVLALQEVEPPLKPFLMEIRADPDADLFFQAGELLGRGASPRKLLLK